MTTREERSLNDPAKQPVHKAEAKPASQFSAIREHIAELMKPGDQTLNNALKKIIVRLDRIDGKSA
jgi:hypothetical protein